ncbi:MAG: hypothetical protein AAGA37_23180, partial [Actinomycetota bacterium]
MTKSFEFSAHQRTFGTWFRRFGWAFLAVAVLAAGLGIAELTQGDERSINELARAPEAPEPIAEVVAVETTPLPVSNVAFPSNADDYDTSVWNAGEGVTPASYTVVVEGEKATTVDDAGVMTVSIPAAADLEPAPSATPPAAAPSSELAEQATTEGGNPPASAIVEPEPAEPTAVDATEPAPADAASETASVQVNVFDIAEIVDRLPNPLAAPVMLFDVAAAESSGDFGTLSTPSAVEVRVDYNELEFADVADRRNRLQIVRYPECMLTTPEIDDCMDWERIPGSFNDDATDEVVATVPVEAAGQFSALSASGYVYGIGTVAAGVTGDYGATNLGAGQRWSTGLQSGAFTYSYPIPLPAAVAGNAPSVALSYSSQSVDSMTNHSNTQPSDVGLGWNLSAGGFIERRYESCGGTRSNELCWGVNNATISVAGVAGHLVPLDAPTSGPLAGNGSGIQWAIESMPDWTVTRLNNKPTGFTYGEAWVVTDQQGTSYFFGSSEASIWSVPVNDKCGTGCALPYRWNLDRVVDAYGNVTDYTYLKQSGWFKDTTGAGREFTRAGHLTGISWGGRTNATGQAEATASLSLPHTASVEFHYADRCFGTNCGADGSEFKDSPSGLECNDSGGCNRPGPAFFSKKRLDWIEVTTNVNGVWKPVDHFKLTTNFLVNKLWLEKVEHYAFDSAGNSSQPLAVKFFGTAYGNRATNINSLRFDHYRISKVQNELGAETTVVYGQPHEGHQYQCWDKTLPAGKPPTPAHYGAGKDYGWAINDSYCFATWYDKDGPEGTAHGPEHIVFNKWVVTQITSRDTTNLVTDPIVTTYHYNDDPAWVYADDLIANFNGTPQHYSQWVGHGDVTVRVQGGGRTQYRFYRGMNESRLNPSDTRQNITVTDSWGTSTPDHEKLRGQMFEVSTFGSDNTLYSRVISNYEIDQEGSYTYDHNGETETLTAERVENIRTQTWSKTEYGGRTHTVERTFSNDHGGIITERDLGDAVVADDTVCTQYSYNTGSDLLLVQRVHVNTACDWSTTLGQAEMYYDGLGWNGNAQRPSVWKSRVWTDTGAGEYRETHFVHDDYGRQVSVTTGLGNAGGNATNATTSVTFTPLTGNPTTITTNAPLGASTSQTIDPRRGLTTSSTDAGNNTTHLAYDHFGRLTSVRLPGESIASQTYAYTINASGPHRVQSNTRIQWDYDNNRWDWASSVAYIDSFGRSVQTHAEAANGNRTIQANQFDNQGRVVWSSEPFYSSGTVHAGAVAVNQGLKNAVPRASAMLYDAMSRPSDSLLLVNGSERLRTSTTHYGNRVRAVSPEGRWTEQHYDVRGRLTTSKDAAGETTYSYTSLGQLSGVTDPDGNRTTIHYNDAGDKTSMVDPSSGTWTYGYDNAGRLVSQQDATGTVVTTIYDTLNRPTTRCLVVNGLCDMQQRQDWRYFESGQNEGRLQTSFVAHDGAWYESVFDYNPVGQVTSETTIIPSVEGALAGSYTTHYAYNAAGQQTSTVYPAAGGLPAETVTQTYDHIGRPETLISSLGTEYVADTGYDLTNRLTSRASGLSAGGVNQTWSYDSLGRLRDLDAIRNGSRAIDLQYGYDDDGLITSIYDDIANQTEAFSYDDAGRLKDAETVGGPDPYNLSYSYRTGGSLQSVTNALAANESYTYNGSSHRLTSHTGADGTTTYDYTPTGNRRLETSGDGTKLYSYDIFGNLVSIDVDPNGGGGNQIPGASRRVMTRLAQATPPAPTAVLVVGDPGSLTAGDTALQSILTGLGYQVTLVDDDDAEATGTDLVVI